jgi:hypothetical protein
MGVKRYELNDVQWERIASSIHIDQACSGFHLLLAFRRVFARRISFA